MCVFNPKDIDFSCTDVDGDSLVYSLITPIDNMQPSGSRPFINVAWTAGHNLANILGAGTACTINPQTGIVSTRSGRLGNYVVAVKCEEYRGGVKIGEVYRDLVLASLNCIFNSKPILEDFELSSVFEFEKEKCIDFVAMDPNLQDTFYLEINSNAYQFGATSSLPPANNTGRYDFSWTTTIGGIDTANNLNVRKLTRSEFEGVGRVGARFCWNLDQCEVLSVDSFWVNVVGFSLGCDGSRDTVSKTVSLPIEKPESDYIIPNVFSPDGDGINDEFYLKQDAFDRCYDALNIKIYNRWGQQVFQSDDAKFSWDGNDESGKELAAGTYFVVLQGFYGGKEVTQNYPVTLFR